MLLFIILFLPCVDNAVFYAQYVRDRILATTINRVFTTADQQQIKFAGINSEAAMFYFLRGKFIACTRGLIYRVYVDTCIYTCFNHFVIFPEVLFNETFREIRDNGSLIVPGSDAVCYCLLFLIIIYLFQCLHPII